VETANVHAKLRTYLAPALIGVCLSCTDEPADSIPSVARTTSDGVETVSYDAFDVDDLPVIPDELLYSTADVSPPMNLFQITGAAFLSDSSLVVAEASRASLLVLDSDGEPGTRIGRRGDGPGEFRLIASVGVTAGDTIYAYDSRLRRLSYFRRDGALVRSHSLPMLGGYRPLSVLDGGRVVGVLSGFKFPLEFGEQRSEVALTVFDPAPESLDTLGTWHGLEFVGLSGQVEDQLFVEPIGFPSSFSAHGARGEIALGATDSILVARYRGVVSRQVISAPLAPAPVSSSDRNAILELLAEWYGESAEDSAVREQFPAFHAVMAEDDGRFWLGMYAGPRARTRSWIRFSADGEVLGRIELPALPPLWPATRSAVHPGVQHAILDVRGGLVAVFRRDQYDVEYIEVRSIG
jgi:hypothetical protein